MSEKEIRKEFAKLIRNWRLNRNIGIRDFCRIFDISPKIINQLEDPNYQLKKVLLKAKLTKEVQE